MARKNIKGKNSPGKNVQEPLGEERMRIVCRDVMQVLEQEKLFLKPDISLWELSRAAGHGATAVSRSINDYMGRSFFELIIRLRLDEAKRLLREAAESGARVKVENIGARSGFNSRSAFFLNFSEYENMSPRKYLEMYKRNKPNNDV